ncbi:hypothetical protein [Catalinimonas niigatensis]|uniref:hypothetical protein n=1 Tax=Catalinimonas niigatensis TaxID=1397264 RepID=UPI002665E51C|nr:hypothetical protein [Catalinimonas niigatensis]WPP53060.1 hypothetical protein PZB72_11800 [Catalinimonas niigatensis]
MQCNSDLVDLPEHKSSALAIRQTFLKAMEAPQRYGGAAEAFWSVNRGLADFPGTYGAFTSLRCI